MKIFVLAGNLPVRQHTVRAASQVLHCLVSELTARCHQVALQVILRGEDRREWNEAERAAMDEHKTRGVEFLPCLFRSDYQPLDARAPARRAAQAYRRFITPVTYFYPEVRLAPIVDERVCAARADALLIFWNPEGLAAAYGVHRVPKLVYYGMPDHAATAARLADAELFDLQLPPLARFRQARDLDAWERAHLQLMLDCDVCGNLSADHARYYTRHGHARSVYLPNIWPDAPAAGEVAPRAGGRLKIIGSVGRPAATGNTYGLKFIGEEIVPRLDAELGAGEYELHILGRGEPVPAVRRGLQSPSVRVRGWVEDIDAEIRSADVFLVANNVGRYRGSHTRFLHAWSLKACAVGHAYNATANPEMVHGENVLLGETADGIVQQILKAGRDPALRRRVGEGGWRTYRAHFTPQVVVGRMLQELESLTDKERGASNVARV